jgi:hypothetical protein
MPTPANYFELSLAPSTYYNFSVNWGDGQEQPFKGTTSSSTTLATLSHYYTIPGRYDISLTENKDSGLVRLYYNNTGDKNKIIEIEKWGSPDWTSMKDSFEGCASLSAVATDAGSSTLSGVTNFNSAWSSCASLSSFPLIDTSNATSMVATWKSCTSLSLFPLLNTSNVGSFGSAFLNCPIKSFPLIDTSKCTNFSSMLYGTKIVDAPLLNTLSGINFNAFLGGCTELTGVPLFDLSNATDVSALFYLSNKLKSIPLFNTSKAINFRFFTSDCTSLTSFPLIDTSKGTNFEGAWYSCYSLSSFPLIDTSKGTDFDSAWYNCNKLTSFPKIDTSNATTLGGSWSNCTSLTSFPALSTPKVTILFSSNTGGAWENCASLSSFPLIDTSKVTNFIRAWQFCTSLSSFPLINIDSANTFTSTWNNCRSLKSFPPLDFSKAKGTNNFNDTWNGCTSLTSFPTISAEGSISRTWMNCTSLTGLGEGSYLKLIGTFGATFQNCFALVTLPAMDTLSATDFGTNSFNLGPWNNCRSLKSFPLIDTRNVTTFYGAWQNCYSLSASEFPTLNMSKMTNGTNCFNGVKLTSNSYSAILASLCATNINTGVIFHGGNSNFTPAGSAARLVLTNSRGWTITDGGSAAPFTPTADYLLGTTIPLAPNTTLQLDLPMTSSNTVPPLDLSNSINPSSITKIITNAAPYYGNTSPYASIGTDVVRAGKTYSGYFQGTANGGLSALFSFPLSGWNELTNSFSTEAWVYLPTGNLNVNSSNYHNNAIFGVGAPNSGGPSLGVVNDGTGADPRLSFLNGNGLILKSQILFPTNQWVHAAITYNETSPTTSDIRLYQNGSLVGMFFDVISQRAGTTPQISQQMFIVGSRDYNTNTFFGYAAQFRGYICNVRHYYQI